MATQGKKWNAIDAKEREDRRKEKLLMKRLEDSNEANRDSVIKEILEEKGINNPNLYRSEMARLNNLASNFDLQKERELKKSYENKWSQSSAGIQDSVENQRIRQELSDYNYNLSNNRTQMSYRERQELNRKKLELQNQLRFSDAQLRENKNSWISQTQAEDDRLAAYNEQKNSLQNQPKMQAPSSIKVGKYAGMTSAEVRNAMLMKGGYRDRSGATIPYANRNQGKPGQQSQGQGRGMPREMVQSPAMAQKTKSWTPNFKGEQLDDLYRSELASWQKGLIAAPKFNRNNNPYLNQFENDQYYKNKRATEYSMANYQNPNAMSDYYKNLYS